MLPINILRVFLITKPVSNFAEHALRNMVSAVPYPAKKIINRTCPVALAWPKLIETPPLSSLPAVASGLAPVVRNNTGSSLDAL